MKPERLCSGNYILLRESDLSLVASMKPERFCSGNGPSQKAYATGVCRVACERSVSQAQFSVGMGRKLTVGPI